MGWHISQELLDVPHLHLTLTIAKEMSCYFDHDRSLLKRLLAVFDHHNRRAGNVPFGQLLRHKSIKERFYLLRIGWSILLR